MPLTAYCQICAKNGDEFFAVANQHRNTILHCARCGLPFNTGAVSLVTEKQKQVLVRLCVGLPPKEVALQLGISVKTVEKHRNDVRAILGVPYATPVELLIAAVRNGLMECPCCKRGKVLQ